jgi:antitoxin (DNA-binding transcriptional repressor) of toxin-antitoxin stability system
MQTIDILELSASCEALIDRVAATGERICITRCGQPIAELRPVGAERPKSPFGLLKGSVEVLGDIISPIDLEWDANGSSGAIPSTLS